MSTKRKDVQEDPELRCERASSGKLSMDDVEEIARMVARWIYQRKQESNMEHDCAMSNAEE